MTVVDVNTGKFTGQGGNLEETVTKNNLEAAEEIVRQLRLRDIGGIIVVDFIDMVLESNRDLVLRRLVECLGRDRTKHQVAEVTSLGLVQMTRKRIGQGLLEAFSTTCETCGGRGLHVSLHPGASRGPAAARPRRPVKAGRRNGRGVRPRRCDLQVCRRREPLEEAPEEVAARGGARRGRGGADGCRRRRRGRRGRRRVTPEAADRVTCPFGAVALGEPRPHEFATGATITDSRLSAARSIPCTPSFAPEAGRRRSQSATSSSWTVSGRRPGATVSLPAVLVVDDGKRHDATEPSLVSRSTAEVIDHERGPKIASSATRTRPDTDAGWVTVRSSPV